MIKEVNTRLRYIRIERGFALKWYFNHRLIYIWSPKSGDFDSPRAFHPFTDHINVNISINGVLELRNITQDLSGHYQCIVMTYEAFESKQAHLQVLIPEDDFILERIISPRFVEYRCAVNNIYPNPILNLRWSSPVIFSVTKYGLQGENGLFDVSESIYTSNRNALEANVSCQIQILNTNYNMKFVNPVKIKALHVPDIVILEDVNEPQSLYLDCDYEIHPKEKGFVMKWYFNEKLIYQWIPDRQPLALNTFKNMIDVNTTVNRGILIREISFNTSGTYKCDVQTFESTDSKSAGLQVVVPEDSLELQHVTKNGLVFCRCDCYNIYPEPKLTIMFGENFLLDVSKKVNVGENGLYNASMVARVHSIQANNSPILISCILTIPGTSYMRKEESVFYDTEDMSLYDNIMEEFYAYNYGSIQSNTAKLLIYIVLLLSYCTHS
uniref:CSON000850 protein n=2 Tax=Culicoides sonorensis TaxID=179676 RepID=A0A336L6C8_CULSO